MARDEEVVRTVAQRVLAHLAQCPNAADTVDGIREWWLAPQPTVDLHVVEAALKWLVSAGLVDRAVSMSGAAIYRRAARVKPTRQNEAEREDNS